jgi:hypothetical protein
MARFNRSSAIVLQMFCVKSGPVLEMVVVAAGWVSPAETIGNRRHRQDARRRLTERYRETPPAADQSQHF